MIIVVNDANILIDLVKLELLPHFFAMELKFYTTDLILNELHDWQVLEYEHYINIHKLTIMNLTDNELSEVQKLQTEKRQLSEQDCSAIVCAQKVEGTIITSDKNLRNFATSKTLTVVGHLWMFDKMIEQCTITPVQAIYKLKELIEQVNPRLNLPEAECKSRISNWKRGS
jgi:predicted nucleic acid-binding protein